MDLFKELLPNILQQKEPLELEEKDYVPYVINHALMSYIDTVLYANEMNMNYDLDKKLQYDFLFNSIRKYKRSFQPWLKAKENVELDACCEYFGYPPHKMKQMINILTPNQRKEIVEKVNSKVGRK